MLIDLRELREPLAEAFRKWLAAFSTKNPRTPICTVGLWGDGFHGSASLYLDTPDHSANSVKKYATYGPDWYGEDQKARFCNSPCDFPYQIGELAFPGYPDFYEVDEDEPVEYLTLEGAKERAEPEEGDEGKNRLVFPFLKAVVADLQPFRELSRVAPFRAGVRMHDSRCEKFWLVDLNGVSVKPSPIGFSWSIRAGVIFFGSYGWSS